MSECYGSLKKADKISEQNGNLAAKILIALVILVVITTFLTTMHINMNDGEDVGSSIGYGLIAGFISLGISSSIGQIILLPLAGLIAWPFMNLKEGDSKTKWDFNQIPQIRKFLDMNLPHKFHYLYIPCTFMVPGIFMLYPSVNNSRCAMCHCLLLGHW